MSDPAAPAPRLLGVDLARAVALVGMMAVHIVPATISGPDGSSLHATYLLFGGKASALFAVLAGLSLALVSGRTQPHEGEALRGTRRGILARAAMVAVIGMTLGSLPSGIAVILVNYAALFVVVLPFLGLRARTVAWWAAAWLLLAPLASHLLRSALAGAAGPGPGPVPGWLGLVDPLRFGTDLLLSGYYPVLTWTGYLLVGLALGRSHLLQPRGGLMGPLLVALGGLVLLATSKALSTALTAMPTVLDQLTLPTGSPLLRTDPVLLLQLSMYGTTPTTSWWWLAVSAPHSGTSLDLLHTTGFALLAVGLLSALVLRAPAALRTALVPLAATGAMTLSLYTLHVLVEVVRKQVSADPDAQALQVWALQVAVAVVLATAWRALGTRLDLPRQGPLELVTAQAAAAARGRPRE